MQKPWVMALAAGVVVLLVAFALPLMRMGSADNALADGAATEGLPWQVARLPEGRSRVFGLEPGRHTLADVQARLGDALQVAVVARLGDDASLEALVEPYAAGFVAGRLVLAFEAPVARRQAWRTQATGSEPMEGGVRRFHLRAADLAEAGRSRLVGISFVPTVRLTEADVRQRFGAPAETLDQAGALVLLYPELGLSISVADGQRGVLQYVAPGDFVARLRAPLAAQPRASAPGPVPSR